MMYCRRRVHINGPAALEERKERKKKNPPSRGRCEPAITDLLCLQAARQGGCNSRCNSACSVEKPRSRACDSAATISTCRPQSTMKRTI